MQNSAARKKSPLPLTHSCLKGLSWLYCSCLCRRPGRIPAHGSLAANCIETDATGAWYRRAVQQLKVSVQHLKLSHTKSFQRVGNKCQSIRKVGSAEAAREMSQHSPSKASHQQPQLKHGLTSENHIRSLRLSF